MIRVLKNHWPILLLVCITFFLRIIRLEELFYFTYDESVFAFVGRRLILWHHIPLIGGATPLGFHVAPYFYWLFAFILVLGKLNPIAWGYASAIIAAATTYMLFLIGSTFSSKKVGFIAASIWTFSSLANIYDRHFWGLTFGPLFSLIIIYCLYQIIKGKNKFIYLLGISLALIIHADLSFNVFLVLTALTWFVFKLPIRKNTLVVLGFIPILILPLVIFDLRHNFANTKPILNFLSRGQNTPTFNSQKFKDNFLLFPRTFTRLVYIFGDKEVSKNYSYCKPYIQEKYEVIPFVLILASIMALVGFSVWSFKQNKNKGWKIVSLILILYFIGIQIYGTVLRADIFEHYLTGLLAIFALILAKLISFLPKRILFFILALFVALNLYKFLILQNSMGLKMKRKAIEYTMGQVDNKPFSLDSLSTCWKLNGYRYLFAVFGREPVKSYVDPNFAYLYGTTPVAEKHPATVVVFVVHDYLPESASYYQRYALLRSHQISSEQFGSIEVIIMDNSSGWFGSM